VPQTSQRLHYSWCSAAISLLLLLLLLVSPTVASNVVAPAAAVAGVGQKTQGVSMPAKDCLLQPTMTPIRMWSHKVVETDALSLV
jgi:hypothetical protein